MNKIIKNLKKYNQNKILKYINNYSLEDNLKILEDLKNIDFKLMNKLYIKSYIDKDIDLKKISPLEIITNINNEEEKEYIEIGKNIISNNQYGIVIMAGGNASRLGINKPKGLLELNIDGKKISLFEIYINKLKEIYLTNKVYLNVYIMINRENANLIKDFFDKNNYFNYPKDKIKFFIQQELPLLSVDGKLLLKNKNELWMVPNGNGNVFKSLKDNELIKDMKESNIKYCLFMGIDNIFVNLNDYKFIGCMIKNNYKLASKTIFKDNSLETSWVFCKYKNRPYMLDNRYIEYFTNRKINDNYCYREKNIIYHLIHIDYIDKFSKINLKYHRAYKEYECLNELGNIEKIKCFKFEQFIYDAFYYAKDMLLYRTTSKEFVPIKTKEDVIKIEKILNNK